MEAKHIDYKTRRASLSPEEKRKEEVEKLHSHPKDETQWGCWNEKIHKHWSQKERQLRAYEITNDSKNCDVNRENKCGTINHYQTTLDSCTCPDFEERMLPCKHIYCLALLLNITLVVSINEYVIQKNFECEFFRPLISISYKNGIVDIKEHNSDSKKLE